MTSSALSFRWLDQRINAIPDGPAGDSDTPRTLVVWVVIGTIGVLAGLLPFLLIQFFPPKPWMVVLAKVGLWVSIIGYAPWFVRSVWVFTGSIRRWRRSWIQQMDHDLTCLRGLSKEIAQFPAETVSEHLKFARDAQARLTAKLAFFFGSFEKLGILPIVIAVGLQLRANGNLTQLPFWQALIALFLAVSYFIAAIASLMRIRMQLYELLLADALGENI